MDEKKTGMGLLRDATRLCAVPGNAGCGVAYALGKTCGDYDGCADCISTSLAIIADRIEREREELDKRLMPEGMEWPRFEDGEKVKFGDEFAWGIRKRKCTATKLGSEGFALLDKSIGNSAWHGYSYTERVKRPEPEVLAADGLPIREGETVYSIHDGKRATVKSLFGNIGLQMESDDGDCFETAPLNLTHERPVLGADGLPIKVGETVWYDGAEYVVDRVYTASDGDYSVDLEFGDLRSATNVWPQLIDHTPPDTQERIDDDATMPPRAYYAKHIGHDVGLKDDAECTEAMVRHLLNRQRGLDKRMMGGAE